MKTLCITLTIAIISIGVSLAEIKNGYSVGINDARESLKNLNALLVNGTEMTAKEKRVIESRIKIVENYIVYFELTESLLERFRMITPELYNDIDTLTNRRGTSTDVYVRFIPGDQARVQAWGVTNIAQAVGDGDAYASEFGENTVSVKIWAVDKALQVLAHELGHVRYQVRHLAEYMKYYSDTYRPGVADPNYMGHKVSDPSGQSADLFDGIFREKQLRYLRDGNNLGESTTTLRNSIRREIQSQQVVVVTSL